MICRRGVGAAALCGILLLTGCGGEMQDLHAYAEKIKAREPSGIEPLPKVEPYKHFEYQAQDRRDPFDPSVLARQLAAAKEENVPTGDSAVKPDPNRTPEFLEDFPLDTLRMVGTLSQEGELWALIQTPDETIQRVSTGNYMGENNGKITRISDAGVELTEIVPDGFGGWIEREASVALSE